jgi:MerR HTH family regulatory protein
MPVFSRFQRLIIGSTQTRFPNTSKPALNRTLASFVFVATAKTPIPNFKGLSMFKTGAVCAATGVPAARLERWQDRNTLKPSRHDKGTTGSGDHRLFSRATIHRIAIAKCLTDLGIAAKPANQAATLFETIFEFGRTLLVKKPTGWQVVNADFSATLPDICGRPFATAVIVDVGQIIKTIDETLTNKKDNT